MPNAPIHPQCANARAVSDYQPSSIKLKNEMRPTQSKNGHAEEDIDEVEERGEV